MRYFFFSSVLPPSRKDELSELMFFNSHQHRIRDRIVHAIELYGTPEIVTTERSLRFKVGELGEVQSLYALEGTADGPLAGAMVYARVSIEKVVLLHMCVAAPFSASSRAGASELLPLRMTHRLKRIAFAIKGVQKIEVLYGRRGNAARLDAC
jgi:hypothetical protein